MSFLVNDRLQFTYWVGGAFGRAPKGPVDAWLLANQLAMTSRQWLSISWLALKPKIQFS